MTSPDLRARDEELAALHAHWLELNGRIRDAVVRQRLSREPAEREDAHREEQAHVLALDRLMDRIRAVESKQLLGQGKQRWR